MAHPQTRPPITIADFDARWPVLYKEERSRIVAAIGPWVADIQHVGSTAVPGLGAKPIIDIMIGLRSLDHARHCIAPLEAIGYQYIPEYEDELPERRYFRRPGGGAYRGRGTHHLHMVETSSEFWERHLLFRDYLRDHAEVARAYEALKRRLAAHYGADHEGYTEAKTGFITDIEAKARGLPEKAP